jgi:hypothetical protein
MIWWRWIAIGAILLGCTETVVEVIPIANLSIEGVPAALVPGGTAQLTARARGAGGEALTNRPVSFSTSNATVASVTSSGLVSAITTGTVTITATSEGVTGSTSLTINYPVPSVSAVDPASILSATAATLTVRGTGFYPVSVIRVNGVARTTTFVSAAELRTNLAASDFPTGGVAVVTVFNPAPGGGSSGDQQLTLRANPCGIITPLTAGSTVTGSLDAANDCRLTNSPLDYYSIVPPANQFTTIRMTSTQLDPYLALQDSTGLVLASHEDNTANDRNSTLIFYGPAATYRVSATSALANQAGSYTLAPTIASTFEPVACHPVWLVNAPVVYTLNFTVATTDCTVTQQNGVFYSDRIYVMLKQGQSMVVTLESAAFDPYLLICDKFCQRRGEDDNGGGGTTARLLFRAEAAGEHFIDARTRAVNQTGAYRLTVTINCCS